MREEGGKNEKGKRGRGGGRMEGELEQRDKETINIQIKTGSVETHL